ncbi:MAG: methionyl-tRNA formyltransferase [Candidatus Kaiserbacteria bacterium]|nr:methionyl-tRNA formyltransferase [Candidatus Kaiserbacteria bacterium]
MTKNLKTSDIPFVFFGTGRIALFVALELEAAGHLPALVVTAPDKAKGRGMEIGQSLIAQWAESRRLEILKPEKLDDAFIAEMGARAPKLFVVADYGQILHKALLDLPERGTLNMHPSLLPRLRGASPIRSAILNDEKVTGVTIMLVDEKMDHGPVIAQKRVDVAPWPPRAAALEETLARAGGKLLAEILPHWTRGEIEAHEQNHDIATYSLKFTKSDGLLDLNADAHENLRKIRALEGWPGTFAYFERGGKQIRVGILDAHIENGALVIDTVKPEGKSEMKYEEFLRSGARPL